MHFDFHVMDVVTFLNEMECRDVAFIRNPDENQTQEVQVAIVRPVIDIKQHAIKVSYFENKKWH